MRRRATAGDPAPLAPRLRVLGSVRSAMRRRGDPVAVLVTERPGSVLGQRVAVALAVRGAHERGDHLEVPLRDLGGLAPEVGQTQVDVELEQVDAGGSLQHALRVGNASDGIPPAGPSSTVDMGRLRFGPARIPARESPGGGRRAPARARLHCLRDRLRVGLLDGLSMGGAARRARARARRRALRARAALRLHGPRGARAGSSTSPSGARPAQGSPRPAGPRRSSSTPDSCSGGAARTRSTPWSTSSASCASGSRARAARSRSASR